MKTLQTRIFPYFLGAILSLAAVVACSHYSRSTHEAPAAITTMAQAH